MQQAISAGHEITLQVAKEILEAKGNAFDAAIAAHCAMFITEPCMASAGGNGFALTRTAEGQIQFFDFFCQTPLTKKTERPLDFYPVQINFGEETEEFHIGLGSAAMPGSIAGIFALHRHFGSMPFKDLVQPAIQLAKEGVILNDFQSFDLKLLYPIFQQDTSVKDIFFKNDKIKKKGDVIQMEGMADFLDFIAREGERGFYHGEIAKTITNDSQQRGGFLTREDFEKYKVNIISPLQIPFKNKILHLPNGPSKGGAMLALMLSEVDNKVQSLALAIQKTQNIIQQEAQIKIRMDEVYPANNFQLQPSVSSLRGTSHFNILDKWGNAISLTSSIGEGCGYFIPHTNMQLNNMLGEIFLLPNGAHSWTPNTRMHSMMTPTMVTDENQNLEFIAGTGGANRIPYAIGQVIYHLYEQQLDLEKSTTFPRVHFQDGKFQVEKSFEMPKNVDDVNWWDLGSMYFGGVHSILKNKKTIEAIGDARRYGVAEVF